MQLFKIWRVEMKKSSSCSFGLVLKSEILDTAFSASAFWWLDIRFVTTERQMQPQQQKFPKSWMTALVACSWIKNFNYNLFSHLPLCEESNSSLIVLYWESFLEINLESTVPSIENDSVNTKLNVLSIWGT